MNFRILAAPVWSRGRVIALLAATALSASLLAPGAQAQQPGAKGRSQGGAEGCSQSAGAHAAGTAGARRGRSRSPSPPTSRFS